MKDGRFEKVEGTDREIPAQLVLLAMGFLGPVQDGMIKDSGVELDKRGNVLADMLAYKSTKEKIFSCGDMRRGQSLVVWAIREGRQCARAVDLHLMGKTDLPR
jgi:glutamate synthase (NADPH/NADH) small chain